MWYVIHTTTGREHEVCLWINTFVHRKHYSRCFVPLYEDVWKKQGIGHISAKKLFPGYLFIESDEPEELYEDLKELGELSMLLSSRSKGDVSFLTLNQDESRFFENVLREGIMKVSYVHMGKSGKPDKIIGPLEYYRDDIVKLDISHRRAMVELLMLGETKRMKFGVWTDADPKIDWIEKEKSDKTEIAIDHDVIGYKVGDKVINTTGIYGDEPLEIIKVDPVKGCVSVGVMLFGSLTAVEMAMEDLMPVATGEGSEQV